MNILFITTRDIYSHLGERSLMLGKDLAIRNAGINTYYFSLRFNPKNCVSSEFNVIETLSTKTWLFNQKIVMSYIEKALQKIKPAIVVVSGVWLYVGANKLAKLIKKYNAKISLDMQGALEEIIEYNMFKNSKLLSLVIYKYLSLNEKHFINKHVSLIEVVSHNAVEYIRRKFTDFKKEIAIVPCGLQQAFSDNEYQEYRHTWQKNLNLNPKEINVAYCGSFSPWQRINDTINLVKKNQTVNFFIFTDKKNHSVINSYNLNNLKALYFTNDTLTKVLCAFDYGILLRHENTTNFFAFPNKASEYLNSRLQIIVDSRFLGCICKPFEDQFVDINVIKNDTIKNTTKVTHKQLKSIEYNKSIEDLIQKYHILSQDTSKGTRS